MTIVSQNYNNMITNLIINEIIKATTNIKINSTDNVFNYINMIKGFDEIVNKGIILAIQAYLEQLDTEYTNSIERKRKYDVKDYCSRTILTIFGEITFKRHFFESKLDGSCYCYVDRQLGLKKYQYFDPYIRSLVVQKVAETSISAACREINELIGARVSLDSKTKFLSRQTARNIILEAKIAEQEDKELDTPEEIYIIADEKWIPTQRKKDGSKHKKNDHDKKVMVKSIVVFDDIRNQVKEDISKIKEFLLLSMKILLINPLIILITFMMFLKLKEFMLWAMELSGLKIYLNIINLNLQHWFIIA